MAHLNILTHMKFKRQSSLSPKINQENSTAQSNLNVLSLWFAFDSVESWTTEKKHRPGALLHVQNGQYVFFWPICAEDETVVRNVANRSA